jgi:hypothetical protein
MQIEDILNYVVWLGVFVAISVSSAGYVYIAVCPTKDGLANIYQQPPAFFVKGMFMCSRLVESSSLILDAKVVATDLRP